MNPEKQPEDKDPEQAKFRLKAQGLELFERGLLFLALCLSYFIFYCCDHIDPQEQRNQKIAYTCMIILMICGSQYPITTITRLNVKIFFYEKILFVLFCGITFSKIQELSSYQQNEYLPSYIAMQSALISCYMIPFKLHLINLTVTWVTFSLLIVMHSGFQLTWVYQFQIIFTMCTQIFQKRTGMVLEDNLEQLFKSLEASQMLLKQVFNYLPEGVLICSMKEQLQKLQFWNQSFQEIIESSSSQGINQKVTVENMESIEVQISEPYPTLVEIANNLFDQRSSSKLNHKAQSLWSALEEILEFETRQLKMNKSKLHLQAFKMKMPNEDKTIIFLRDITAIRGNQKQRIFQQMQSVFLSSISHDLKTPINQILSTTQYLRLRNSYCQEFRIYRLQETSCNFMLSLIDDITDLSKFQLNKFELNPTSFCFQDLVEEVFELFELKIKEKGLELERQIDDEVPKMVTLDRKRLKQILMNLISNAVKFTMHGSIILKARIQRQNEQPERQFQEEEKKEGDFISDKTFLQLQVSDTGVGMSENGQKKLFQLFGMLNKTKGINSNGTGLGLVICKRLSEAMGGSICVRSIENKGTTFTVQLLLQNYLEDLMQDNYLESFTSQVDLITSKIEGLNSIPDFGDLLSIERFHAEQSRCDQCNRFLVIDDDSFNNLAIELLIDTLYKMKVDSALSAQQGIQRLQSKLSNCCGCPYDFVFVDLNMPLMNGDEMMELVSRKVAANEGGMGRYEGVTKFVLCTAQTPGNWEEMRKKGFTSYLGKPIRLDELQNVVGKRRES